jgi:hypothetical protein
MDLLGPGLGILISVLWWGGIIAVIVLLVRKFSRREPGAESAGTGVRRFFQYGLLILALAIASSGVAMLLSVLITPGAIAVGESELLATALAFVIVGVPVYLLVLRWTRRKIDSDPAERASLGWAAYANMVLIGSLVVMIGTGAATLLWLLGVDEYDASRVAFLIVAAVVWLAHWRFARPELPAGRTRAQLFFGSGAGLVTTSVAASVALGVALGALYDEVFSTGLVSDWWRDLRSALAFLVVGVVTWLWYWLRHYEHAERTPLWEGYVLLLGVLGGLLTAVSALGTVLFSVLEWLFGSPEPGSAAAHFEVLPGAAAALGIGVALWWYHRSVLRSAASTERQEVDRIYEYLLSGLGLVTAAIGVTLLLTAFFQALGPSPIAEAGSSEVDTLLGAISALVIGAPIWWVTWSSIQRRAAADPATELGSPTRRIYLFLLFGMGALISIVSLITTITTIFDDIISSRFGMETISESGVAISLLITVGLIAGYHWSVYQKDREALPEAERPGPSRDVVVLAPNGLDGAAIAEATGTHVRVVQRLDEVPVDIDAVITAITATESERVLVVTTDSGEVLVIPVGSVVG